MRVVNLSHGALYLLGGYIGYSVLGATGNWFIALGVSAAFAGLLGFLFERTMLKRVRDGGDLPQTLLTIALSIIIADVALAIWGGHPLSLSAPRSINFPVRLFGIIYPGLSLHPHDHRRRHRGAPLDPFVQDEVRRRRAGQRRRPGDPHGAGLENRPHLHHDVRLSTLLAGIAGVLGGTYLQLSPGEDGIILMYSLVVIIVGGIGSLPGAFISALLLGQILSFGLAFAPQMAMFLVFIPMAIVLAIRPQGLFGKGA